MTVQELEKIVATKSHRKIKKGIKAKGFAIVKEMDITDLLKVENHLDTQWYESNRHAFMGRLIPYHDDLFLWYEQLKYSNRLEAFIPNKLLIFKKGGK